MKINNEILNATFNVVNTAANCAVTNPCYPISKIAVVLNAYTVSGFQYMGKDADTALIVKAILSNPNITNDANKSWYTDGRIRAILQSCWKSQPDYKATSTNTTTSNSNNTNTKTDGNTPGVPPPPDPPPGNFMAFLSQYKIPIIIGSASVVTLAVVYKTAKKGKKRKK